MFVWKNWTQCLLESGEQRYIKAINNNNNVYYAVYSRCHDPTIEFNVALRP